MSINHGYHVVPLSQTSLINDANLVSYWKMDGNSLDSKGTNHGTNTDMNFSNVGKFGNCAYFNGSTSYILVPNNSSINPTSSITINAWVNVSVFKENANVISKSYIAAVPPHMQYSLKFTASSPYASPGFEVTIGDVAKLDCYSSEVLVTNKWYCLTGTYDGNNIKLYIDGVLSKSVTQTGSLSTYTGSLSIGRWNVNASQYFNGKIDEVTIFSRALTSSEILQLATGCQNKELYSTSFYSDPNLVAYYRFEGNSNATIGSVNGSDTNITYGTSYGKFGQGALFAGNSSTSKIDFGAKIIPLGAKTVSIWLKYLDGGSYYAILDETGTDSSNYGNWWYCNLSKINISLKYGSSGNNAFYFTSNKLIGDNFWHHIVLTWDGTTSSNKANLYIDGILDSSKTSTAVETTTPTYNTWLGRYHDNAQWTFNGSLDDLAIFNRALTAREVLQLYRQR